MQKKTAGPKIYRPEEDEFVKKEIEEKYEQKYATSGALAVRELMKSRFSLLNDQEIDNALVGLQEFKEQNLNDEKNKKPEEILATRLGRIQELINPSNLNVNNIKKANEIIDSAIAFCNQLPKAAQIRIANQKNNFFDLKSWLTGNFGKYMKEGKS